MGGTRHRLGYRPAIDGLRAMAILLVMLHHGAAFLVPSAFGVFVTGGFLGVDLFFVLSGFLITSLLVERWEFEGERGFGRFYLRRALRLLPAVLFLLVIHIVFIALVHPELLGPALGTTLAVLTYSANYAAVFAGTNSPHLGHMWSLAVEEQFYLVFPFVLIGLLSAGVSRRWIVRLTVVAVIAVSLWRAALFGGTADWSAIYRRTDVRLDAMLIGALLALIYHRLPLSRLSAATVSAAGTAAAGGFLAAALLLQRDQPVLYQGGFTLIAVLAAVMVAVTVDGRWSWCRLLETRPVVMIGRLSYSLYLWHYGVFVFVGEIGAGLPAPVRVVLGFTGAFAGAAISYVAVERPMLRMKARLEQRFLGKPRQPDAEQDRSEGKAERPQAVGVGTPR